MGMQHDLSARAADGASEGLNLDRRAADRQAAHLEAGLADADGDALS